MYDPPQAPIHDEDRPPRRIGWVAVTITVSVIAAIGAALLGLGGVGWAVAIGVPFAVGAVCAWLPGKFRVVYGLIFLFTVPFIIGVVLWILESMKLQEGLMGLFCGAMALAVLLPGYFLGFGFGAMTRRYNDKSSERSAWPMRMSIAFAMGMPFGLLGAEAAISLELADETVTVFRPLSVSPEVAWTTSLFRGEAAPTPRLPMRLGLTRAQTADGEISSVGDERTYRFLTGHVTLRVTESQPPTHLAFRVVEQVGVEDRAAHFLGGQMRLLPISSGTEASLTIKYAPRMTPRWMWRPLELWAAEATLADVLDRFENRVQMVPPEDEVARPVAHHL